MDYKKAFAISILVHFLFLHSALNSSKASGDDIVKGVHKPKSSEEMIADKPTEIELKETPKTNDTKGELLKKKAHKSSSCSKSFGGIGVGGLGSESNPDFMKIEKVWANYPGAEAGLQAGDIIMNYSEVRGKIGSTVNVDVVREGIRFTVPIKRAKICLEDMAKEGGI